jgi:hypothetical protein
MLTPSKSAVYLSAFSLFEIYKGNNQGLTPTSFFLSFLFYALSPGVADAKMPSVSALVGLPFF